MTPERKAEIKLEKIAAEIRRISRAMRRFNNGPVTRRCVAVLLKDQTGLGLVDINKILNGIEALEDKYLHEEG